MIITIIIALLQVTFIQNMSLEEMKDKGCAYDRIANQLEADMVIGAIFPIQAYRSNEEKYVLKPDAVTWVESFLYAVDNINQNPELLPGITLGYDIRNSCNEEQLVINYTLNYMIDTAYVKKTRDVPGEEAMCICENNTRSVVAAVVGEDASHLSAAMSNLLSTDHMPQISYKSTSPTLGNKSIYSSFLRTLPSDLYETQAITDLLHSFNWSYVSVLVSDDDYGRLALDNLKEEMKQKSMCMALERTFDPSFPGDDLKKIVTEIKQYYEKTNVVVLWCQVLQAIQIIEKAYDEGMEDIIWIGTEISRTDFQVLKLKKTNLKIIGVTMSDRTVPDFMKHKNALQRVSPLSNPWLELFWLALGVCPINQTSSATYPCLDYYEPTGSVLPKDYYYNVMAAVFAIAHGLHKLFDCHQVEREYSCPRRNDTFKYETLLQYIKQAQFTIPSTNNIFKFAKNGDVDSSSYKFAVVTETKRGKNTQKQFKNIGEWNGETREIKFEEYLESWTNNTRAKAVCSSLCHPGSYIIHSSVACCWQCIKCPKDTVSTHTNQINCEVCRETEISNTDRTRCIDLENSNLSIYKNEGQIMFAVSLLGIFLTMFVLLVFIRHWETPVVKSSSREMSVIQLISIMLLFCLPILFMMEISKPICMVQTSCFGTLYSLIIAFIVIKTYRLLCVFKRKHFTKISKYLQNRYQVFMSFILVLLELIAIAIWYSIHQPHEAMVRDEVHKQYVYYCGDNEDILLYAIIGYIFFLSLVSGFMAFKARSLPENFNEAQFIWFAMFISCLCWLIFLPLYLSLDRTKKPVVLMCITMVCNYCLLLLLYGYKIKIILFNPSLNTQANFRKMAANATVTTFLNEVNSTGRPREQSVISFDFDGMFHEYRNRMKQNSVSLPTRKLTIKLRKPNIHFPSTKKTKQEAAANKAKRRSNKRTKAKRNKTLQLQKDRNITTIQRSVSLDEIKIHRISMQNLEEQLQGDINQNAPCSYPQSNSENNISKTDLQSITNTKYDTALITLHRQELERQQTNSFDSDILSPQSTNSLSALITSDSLQKERNKEKIIPFDSSKCTIEAKNIATQDAKRTNREELFV